MQGPPDVLLVGTGEYTTGIVSGNQQSQSDKKVGVVGLCFFEMRRLGLVGKIVMAGTNGTKFPGIRRHFEENIKNVYGGLDVSFTSFPSDEVERDEVAYEAAMLCLCPSSLVVIFTPDNTHFRIAQCALRHGHHVMVTKPLVMRLEDHHTLLQECRPRNVLLCCEVHKRWDPCYNDARHKMRQKKNGILPATHVIAWMTQPIHQLGTFKMWAGKYSDISYYLNSHHVDYWCWCVGGEARAVRVQSTWARGRARQEESSLPDDIEDSITLNVQYEHRNRNDNDDNGQQRQCSSASFTASWVAPRSDVHTQQGFMMMGHGGMISVDQARRGYQVTTHNTTHGLQNVNPLYMKYSPGPDGHFDGHSGYGYKSLEAFVKSASDLRNGKITLEQAESRVASARETVMTTAILQAGRMSIDSGGAVVSIHYDDKAQEGSYEWSTPLNLKVEKKE